MKGEGAYLPVVAFLADNNKRMGFTLLSHVRGSWSSAVTRLDQAPFLSGWLSTYSFAQWRPLPGNFPGR